MATALRFAYLGQHALGSLVLRKLAHAGLRPALIVTAGGTEGDNAARFARGDSIRLLRIGDIGGATAALAGAGLDAALCCCWPARLPAPVLSAPRLGWVNLHPSALPRYRGPAPIERQIERGERVMGCTAHVMTPEFDAGPVLARDSVPIKDRDDARTLRVRASGTLALVGARALEALARHGHGGGERQDESRATYAPQPPATLELDPRQPVAEVDRLVRSRHPYYPTIVRLAGQRVPVVRATPTRTAATARRRAPCRATAP